MYNVTRYGLFIIFLEPNKFIMETSQDGSSKPVGQGIFLLYFHIYAILLIIFIYLGPHDTGGSTVPV